MQHRGGHREIHRSLGVFVSEESAVPENDILQIPRFGFLPAEIQHRAGNVHGENPPALRRGVQCKGARSGAHIEDGIPRFYTQPFQDRLRVFAVIAKPLVALVVDRRLGRIAVINSRMTQLIVLPGGSVHPISFFRII